MRNYIPKIVSAFTILFSLFFLSSKAQLIISNGLTPAQLAQKIAGPGVKITNPVINCGANGYGSYTAAATNLGSNAGVILTTGVTANAVGPNNVGNKTTNAGTAGDPQLNTVTGRTTFDACTFEFDITPEGDTLKFDYVFASEEYPEWVNSQFNDVFGFFISGPGIVGQKNIAIIPGGAPCTINTVNNGTTNTGPCVNCAYYVDNQSVPGQTIQYDGFTKNLTAVSAVQPCQTYHLKLVIADASDRLWDSGVFIEEIESNNITISLATQNGLPQMIEGCNNATVTFTRTPITNKTLSIPFYFSNSVQGTATNNTDYTSNNAGGFVFFGANVGTASFNITAINDGITEGIEFLKVYVGNPLCPGSLPTDSLRVEIHDSLYLTVTPPVDSICPGQSVQLNTLAGGNTFNWLPVTGLSATNIRNPIASPIVTTTYTVTTTAGACSNTRKSRINVSNTLLNQVVTNITCNGAANGSITLNPSGGFPPYTYTWSGTGVVVASKNQSNLGPGTYTVTVKDRKNCSVTQSFTITQPAPVTGGLTSPTVTGGFNVACNGALSASITLSPSGGTAPYTFTWTGPSGFTSNSQNISGLGAGTYCVIIRDANGCTNGAGATCVTLTQPAGNLTATVSSQTNVSCNGSANGSATVSPTGGTAPYTITWDSAPVQNTATAINLPPRTYTVAVKDVNNCTATNTITITEPAQPLTANITSQTNVLCKGGSTGTATVSANGGTPPYTYTWSSIPVQFTATATGLPIGTYTVTVKDSKNCSASVPVSITEPLVAFTATLTAHTDVLCKGQATGSLTAAGSGGSGLYTYMWSNGAVTATASGLVAGSYSVNVFDGNGCTVPVNLSATITEPALVFSASISSKTNVFCKGSCTGSATVAAIGGSGSYTYTWTTVAVQNTATASSLCAGAYQVTVKDANGCTTPIVLPVSITEPAVALNGTISNTNITCFGGTTGTITVSATGGSGLYNYSWTGPSVIGNIPNPTGLPAGTYTVQIFDQNGCIIPKTLSATITQPASGLSVTIPSHVNNTCFGGATGSATAVVSGGSGNYTYSWSTSPSQTTATATGLISSTFTVFVTDVNGCGTIVNASVTITQPSVALAATTSQTNVFCKGGSTGVATAIPAGGSGSYTYLWSVGAQNTASVSGLTAGTYNVTVSDANGCPTPVVKTVTITEPTVILGGSIVSSTDVLCFGQASGSITVLGSGGSGSYNYTWSNGQIGATASGLVAGSYTVTIRDNNGCTNTVVRSAVISQPTSALNATITAGNITGVSCFGNNDGQITVTPSGGSGAYIYSWHTIPSQNTSTAVGLVAGTYSVTVSDANGCATSIVKSAIVTQPTSALSASITSTAFNGFNIACNGGSNNVTLTVAGGTPAFTYSWSGPSTFSANTKDLTSVAAGQYDVLVTDSKGCSTNKSITLTEPTDDSLTFVMTPTLCANGSKTGAINITEFGGVSPYTFNWNGPSTVNVASEDLSALDNGAYTLILTDANGCKDTTVITVTQPSSLVTTVTAKSSFPGGYQIQCNGGSTGFINTNTSGGTIPYVRNWTKTNPSGSITNPSNANISALSVGTYELIVTDANGCIDNKIVVMTEPDSITSNLALSSIVTCNGLVNACLTTSATGGVQPYTYSWSGPGSPHLATASICNLGAGTYNVFITDLFGCSNPNLEQQFVITQPAVLSATASVATQILCNNQPTGAINLAVTGGSAPYTFTWTGPNGYTSSLQNITGLLAGTYNVTVNDTNNCSATTNITLIQPPPITPVANIPNPNGFNIACNGGLTGSISLTISGGSGGFHYTWAGPGGAFADSPTISGLGAGAYTVHITDVNNCSTPSDTTFVLTEPTPVAASDSVVTFAGCNGASGGAIKAIASGGVGNYTYSWNTSPTAQLTQTATNLTAGSYTVTVKDANLCSATATAIIPALPLLDSTLISAVKTNILCNAATTGSIVITVNGGVAPYHYVWTGPVTIGDIPNPTNLPAGAYTLVVTDANNCGTQTIHYTLTEPAALSLGFSGINPVSCFGGVNGSINAVVTGGVGPYHYTWSGSCLGCPDSPNLTGLNVGTYDLIVTDANSCSVSGNQVISQPIAPLSATATSPVVSGGFNITCNGASTGTINLTVTGGTFPYTFTWTAPGFGPVNTKDITGLKAKTYTVIVNDQNGCSFTTNITLTQPPLLVISSTQVTYLGGNNISCAGAQDGCIDLTITGGTSPYTYTWTGPNGFASNTEDICSLFAGLYIIVATDANGCTVNKAINLTEPLPLGGSLAPSLFNGGWNIGCHGDSTGFITLTVTGGTSGYRYLWSNGDSTQDIMNLPAGKYNVLVTDPNGCSFRDSVELTEPPILLASIISPEFIGGWNISCNGLSNGIDSLDVVGGTPPYTFSWTGPSPFTSTNEDISGLVAGNYTAIITDDNGCTLVKMDSLIEPQVLDFTLSSPAFVGGNNIQCHGDSTGSVVAAITGGTTFYSYTWNGPNVVNDHHSTIDSLIAGTYTLVVTDTNGCSLSKNITLNEPTPIASSVVPVVYAGGVNISCHGSSDGAINITDGGGIAPYTYSWTDTAGVVFASSQNVDSLVAGTYIVHIADANGCDTTVTTILTEPQELNDSITSPIFIGGNNIKCNGDNTGSIIITEVGGSGPFNHSWTGPNGFISSNDTLTGLFAGTYHVLISDANGCSKNDSITLTQPDSLLMTLTPTVYVNGLNIRCFGDSSGVIIVANSGGTTGYSYSWTGPNGFTASTKDLIGVVAGTYNLTLTDTNGCSISDTKMLTQPTSALNGSLFSPLLAGGFNVSCNGSNDGSIDLTNTGGSPGFTFNWRGPNGFQDSIQDLINLFAGTYTLVILDTNTCAFTDSITLTQPQNPIVGTLVPKVYPGGNNISCYSLTNGEIDLSVTGGVSPYTYSWSTNATTQDITGLGSGSYTVIITDSINCSKTYSQALTQPDTISTIVTAAVVAGGYNITCNGFANGQVDASHNGGSIGFNYNWTGPNGFTSTNEDISNLAAGQYCLITSDTNNCASTQRCVTLTEPQILSLSEIHPPIDCSYQPSSIDLTVSGGTPNYTYTWTDGAQFSASTEDISGLTTGNYAVTVNDANSCQATLQSSVVIYVPDSIRIKLVSPLYTPGNYNISNYGLSDGSILANVTGGTLAYAYSWTNIENTLSNNTANWSNLPKGNYILTVTDFYGCTLTKSIELTEPLDLELPNGFSPNGDGYNDNFLVHGLDVYPDNSIVIFNRWGNQIYSKDGYYDEWDGKNSKSGESLPDGTYFVVLKIKNTGRTLQGYVDLKRE